MISRKERQQALALLKKTLDRHSYSKIKSLPCWQSPWAFPFSELSVLYHLILGRTSLFNISICPAFYHFVFSLFFPKTYLLFQLFFLNNKAKLAEVQSVFNEEEISLLTRTGFLEEADEEFYSTVRVTPSSKIYVLSSSWHPEQAKEFVYIGGDSLLLAEEIEKNLSLRYYQHSLDLCCGAGIHALFLSPISEHVLGSDINPRSIYYARLNAVLNNKPNIRFIVSDIYEEITGTYDLIIGNPPYIFLPPSQSALTFGYSSRFGMEIALKIIRNIDQYMKEDGISKILATSPVIGKEDMLVKELEVIAKNKGLQIQLKPYCFFLLPEHASFYHEYDISHFILYLATIKKKSSLPPSLQVNKLPVFLRICEFFYISFLRLSSFLSSLFKVQKNLHKDKNFAEDLESALFSTMYKNYRQEREGLAKDYLKKGKAKEALEVYEEILAKTFHFPEKLNLCRAMTEMFPNNAIPYFHLGTVYFEEGRLEQAAENYQKALALDTTLPDVLFNLGLISFYQKNYSQALNWWEKAFVNSPDDCELLTDLAQTHFSRFKDSADNNDRQYHLQRACFFYEKLAELTLDKDTREKLSLCQVLLTVQDKKH